MAQLTLADQLPSSSVEALAEIDERYVAANSRSTEPNWVEQYGDVFPVTQPITRLPLNLIAANYQETKGENRFRTLDDKFFDLGVVEYDDGYEARLLDLLAIPWAFRNWQAAPSRWQAAKKFKQAKAIAALVELGTSTASIWDGVNFFSATHFANGKDASAGTFSNYQSVAKDPAVIADLTGEIIAMQGVPDQNGDKVGFNPDVVLLPTPKFQLVSNMLKKELIASAAGTATENNPYLGVLTPVHVPQLTDVNDFYLVDTKALREATLPPWIVAEWSAPEALALRKWDESSDFFKDTGKLKVSSHIWFGTSLAFPHAIRKVVGA